MTDTGPFQASALSHAAPSLPTSHHARTTRVESVVSTHVAYTRRRTGSKAIIGLSWAEAGRTGSATASGGTLSSGGMRATTIGPGGTSSSAQRASPPYQSDPPGSAARTGSQVSETGWWTRVPATSANGGRARL